MGDVSPKKVIKRLVIHVNGSEKVNNLHHDHDYTVQKGLSTTLKPITKKAKKHFYIANVTQVKAIYNCKICGHKSIKKELHNEHMTVHTDTNQIESLEVCDNCVNTTKTPDSYEKCPLCSYYTKNKKSLKVHMKIHSNGTPYKCTECSFSGKDLKELIGHYSDVKDLSCEDCNYTTHVKQQMVVHKRIHTGEKPYACGICNFATKCSSNLHRHMKIHMNT